MKRSTELLIGSAATLCYMAVTGWLFCFGKLNEDFAVMEINYVFLTSAMLTAYYVNYILLHKGVPLPVFACVQIIMLAGGVFVFIKSVYTEPYSLTAMIIIGIIYCVGYLVTAFAAFEPPKYSGLLTRFDVTAVMMVILLFLHNYLELPAAKSTFILCGVSLLLTMAALISQKVSLGGVSRNAVRGNPAGGRILLGAAFACVMALAAAFFAFASGGVQSISQLCVIAGKWVLRAVKTAFLYIFNLIESFLTWLVQFLPNEEYEDALPNQVGGGDFSPSDLPDATVPQWLYFILAGIAIALIVFIIIRLRRAHAKSMSVTLRRRSVSVQRESGLKDAIKRIKRRVVDSVKYYVNTIVYRKTAPGLLAWCEKKAPKEERRRKGESGEAFLLRLSRGDRTSEAADALCSLAGLLEQAFYGKSPVCVPDEVYKIIRTAGF